LGEGQIRRSRKDGRKNRIRREAEKDKGGRRRRWCRKKGKKKCEKGGRQ
jgi:hypothetical protein